MNVTELKNNRKAKYGADELFLNRWSPRAFSTKEVENEKILSLFEAAHWAPSANNFQPWRFIVAQTAEERAVFHGFINEFNLVWCEKAPVLTLILSRTNKDGKPVRSHSFDTGAAWANLALQANKKGLVTHAMGGFNHDQAREVLEIPEDYRIEALVAIGYQGEIESLPANLKQREQPNTREPLEDFIFNGKFGK